MAEENGSTNGSTTNGRGPARRARKRIYPPPEQMAAQQAAAVAKPRAARRAGHVATAEPDFGPEAAVPPAPPVMTAVAPVADSTVLASGDDDASPDGERLELRLSAVGMVDAADVSFSQGALGAARADSVTVDRGAVGAALADRVEISRGYARSILAREVQMDRAAARVIVAAEVKVQRSAVMFLVARRVAGDVRVLLDWRGAVAFGAIAGLVMGLLRRRPNPPND
jgi:hypothetical protein